MLRRARETTVLQALQDGLKDYSAETAKSLKAEAKPKANTRLFDGVRKMLNPSYALRA
ncbi:MAG TPA: hypothetical protein VGG11_20035 [Xanthobacteraceae bacterium]|jgi:hypothetical protein